MQLAIILKYFEKLSQSLIDILNVCAVMTQRCYDGLRLFVNELGVCVLWQPSSGSEPPPCIQHTILSLVKANMALLSSIPNITKNCLEESTVLSIWVESRHP